MLEKSKGNKGRRLKYYIKSTSSVKRWDCWKKWRRWKGRNGFGIRLLFWWNNMILKEDKNHVERQSILHSLCEMLRIIKKKTS